jgi:rod shape-determining protein MreC
MTHMFKKNVWLGRRAFIFIAISLLCMLLDTRNIIFHRVRIEASMVTLPVSYMVNAPFLFFHHLSNGLVTRDDLMEENAHLRVQNIVLQSQLQHFLVLQQENAQLHTLLSSSSELSQKVLEAQILSIDPNLFVQQFTINRGWRDRVFAGQIALDAYGVVGQVVEVQPMTSNVMLVTDPHCLVPVQDARNGLRAMTQGNGADGTLVLKNVTQTNDVKVGDLLLASGLGGRYPYGYPVGKVVSIDYPAGEQFAHIKLEPAAKLNQGRLLLLVMQDNKKSGES